MSLYKGTQLIAGHEIININQISNCITEIPQDIKLELNNGTLTLKAGSKIYVPNGPGVFDTVTIASDLTIPAWGYNGSGLISITSVGDIWVATLNEQSSGSVAPTSTLYNLWYDTANNKIKTTSNTGSTWTDGYSLPLALVTSNGSSWTSIYQVFNGFGYIGSTVFALPNVKGLIPNGRNADGSLKNIKFETESVLTSTNISTSTNEKTSIIIENNNTVSVTAEYWSYDEKKNKFVHNNDEVGFCEIAFSKRTNGVISNWKPKTAFHALDYNDSEYIGHQAMPSTRSITITAGADGASYTAPADGYFTVSAGSTGDGFIQIFNKDILTSTSMSNGRPCRAFMPCSKGDTLYVYYGQVNTPTIKFTYAQGAQ